MITVLRIGHRPQRDKRITTHVALVARAFGADKIVISEEDQKIKETITSVVESWGGDFSIEFQRWRSFLSNFSGTIVHLTMYGIPFEEKINEIKEINGDICIIVGAEKVPPEIYQRATYNLAVGNQPHSEVSSLALFLDRYYKGNEFNRQFSKAKIEIKPSEKGKIVRENNKK
ncbi:MAG: tRNA (cytidine(56)-2'-O)-methyltransferase [Candidatus Methanofastidiosia archaeon]